MSTPPPPGDLTAIGQILGRDYVLDADVPLLVAAVEAVLKEADSAEESARAAGVPVSRAHLSPVKVREAIRRSLAGVDSTEGEEGR